MLLAIVCLLTTVTTVQSENGKAKNVHITMQRNGGYFQDDMLREFKHLKIPISSMEEQPPLEDIFTIKDKDLVTLRGLKLWNDPTLVISSLNSTLDLFSISLAIDVGDLVFSGKIYVNEDTELAGDVRYTMRNVKGSGLVGLAVACDGNFTSTNYFIDYTEDGAELDGNLDKRELHHVLFSETQLKQKVHKMINRLLKKRFDSTLAGISVSHVFGSGLSIVLEMEKRLRDFYTDIVDGILDEVNKRVEDNGLAQIALPDFEVPFTYRILGIDVNGQTLGSEGWIRSLATFVRQGPISLSYNSGNFVVFGSLGLAELRLGYGMCSVKVAGIGPSGNISGTIGTNRVDFAVMINIRNQSITLNNFKITELSDIDVEVIGLGPFNWLASKIASRVIASSKNYIVSTIEPMIKQQIDQVLANLTLLELTTQKKLSSLAKHLENDASIDGYLLKDSINYLHK